MKFWKRDSEQEKEQKAMKRKASAAAIFIYSDWIDIVLMVLGTVGAIGDGMSINVMFVTSSRIINRLGFGKSKLGHGSFMGEVEKCTLQFVYLGLAVLVIAFLEGFCWSKTSERQVLKIRYKYLEAVLRQEVGFFDSQESTVSEVLDGISKDTSLIQEVLSDKVPTFLMHSSVFISGLLFSSYLSWRLFLVALPLLLLLMIPGLVYGKYLVSLSQKSHKEYIKANTILEQALSSIRTIYSFTAEKMIVQKYSDILNTTTKLGIAQGLAKGIAVGTMGLSFAIWAFLAWYGSRLVMYKGESGGRIQAAGLCFIFGGLSLGMALPEIKYFTEASVAAAGILEKISRTPRIDAEDTTGIILGQVRGELEFENIEFTYPSRPDTVVLRDFNLVVPAGQTVALVGSSGSGKSTAISLVQRFYDADQGVVKIDGVDVKKLQLKWIRGKMGLVSQDHALFGTSIKENIMFGKHDATVEEVIAAAMAANAHNFIRQLPEGYETKIGERGAFLSGGQKQRISIARALIKNPAILLLDEATSALDSESEKLVQTALDQASMGRTTLVVAHKLSTVRNANQIAVVHAGRIVEIGSHSDLVALENGHYARMAQLQEKFDFDDADPNPKSRISSVPRSTSSRLMSSVPRSSPASFTAAFPLSSPALFSVPTPSFPEETPSQISQHPPPSFLRLLRLNAAEWKQGLMGCISAMIFGAVQPVYAITMGGVVAAFFAPSHDEIRSRIRVFSLIFASLSVISIIVNLCQQYTFAYMGEKLTRRIRIRVLENILTFEVAWFDEEANSSGALCSRLSKDASLVKSLVADRVSLIVQTASAVIVAIVMGLSLAWKLALVMIAVQPLTILCMYSRKVLLSSLSEDMVKAQSQSTQIAVEAVSNHRIVSSFGCAGKILELFEAAQEGPKKAAAKRAWLAGVGIGSAQCVTFLCWALDFWYGGKLVDNGEISAGAMFKTFFVLVSTGKVIADAGSMTTDLAKGAATVASVFEALDRQSKMQNNIQRTGDGYGGTQLVKISGGIELKKVDFAYPNRPQTLILQGFSLNVKTGTSIGLVGRSGCGKSTVIGLVQRFYDVDRGVVRVDGVDIRELDLGWYRGHTALVGQEPVIFSGSIHDNIVFGKPDASEQEVMEAAKAANAHDFVSSLDEGYETECGDRGVQLSGGQKQRIAIARAIIRNPTILLLDEATSALDLQSEQVVQEALDRIMLGRTTIVVAHRLNTIKKLDCVTYVAEGKVTEQGTYAQLMAKKGAFFNLANLQE
ncbi:putative ABC transporter B family member 8 isoform X2 [Aristolochia californica]